ncbi:MAG TPA: UDP-N-acetylmuramoyl-L-alanine--D-glutamate ligase [Stellaceae bacterium]|nr:UDP-N-acetylmuramoyl-L-alanine--D-glutamate ligase [Stellaceae bacterium]
MRAAELGAARVAIWGLGREGRAAIGFLRERHPRLPLLLLDDAEDAEAPPEVEDIGCAFGADAIARALGEIDLIVKSPGVSLYRGEIRTARRNGAKVTSLLNLWFAERAEVTTVCVTGSKGKSTTSSLIAHILTKLGREVALVGNIGVPITEIDPMKTRYAVIEVSSYQAADFDGLCDIAVLTSLFPEHIDWHGTLAAYYRDKLNLLHHARHAVLNRQAAFALGDCVATSPPPPDFFNSENGVHWCGSEIFDGEKRVGAVGSRYLTRPHNMSNLCAALTAAKLLGIEPAAALDAADGFVGLPHRQQELGEIGGVVFVDDSISTAPESTIAALSVFRGRHITVIVGGYDRGIDYGKLISTLAQGAARTVICLGASGERIHRGLLCAKKNQPESALTAYRAQSMAEAVAHAKKTTPPGGVVLLSPAAPSYGHYHDFAERGEDFAVKAGLPAQGAAAAQ